MPQITETPAVQAQDLGSGAFIRGIAVLVGRGRRLSASATGGMVKMMWWPARPCHGADHGPRPNAKNLVEPEGEDD